MIISKDDCLYMCTDDSVILYTVGDLLLQKRNFTFSIPLYDKDYSEKIEKFIYNITQLDNHPILTFELYDDHILLNVSFRSFEKPVLIKAIKLDLVSLEMSILLC